MGLSNLFSGGLSSNNFLFTRKERKCFGGLVEEKQICLISFYCCMITTANGLNNLRSLMLWTLSFVASVATLWLPWQIYYLLKKHLHLPYLPFMHVCIEWCLQRAYLPCIFKTRAISELPDLQSKKLIWGFGNLCVKFNIIIHNDI